MNTSESSPLAENNVVVDNNIFNNPSIDNESQDVGCEVSINETVTL